MKGKVILSLFDGKACGMETLKQLGIKVDKYYSSEIDKHAIKIANKNHPNIIQLGNVENWMEWELPWHEIDLVIGGSPCQGFSKAGKQLNFDDPRSKLFFEFADIKNFLMEVNSKVKFFLENVSMIKEYRDVITEYMGVEPYKFNSELISAGKRNRLYWTNIKGIELPTEDSGVLLEHIIDSGEVDKDKAYCLDANYFKGVNIKQYLCKSRRQIVWQIPEGTKKGYVEVSPGQCIDLTFIKSLTRRGRLMLEKSNCLTAASYNYCKVTKDWFRLLTPVECERIHGLPDGYTEGVSNTQRYKMIGNGWNIPTIKLFFSKMRCSNVI